MRSNHLFIYDKELLRKKSSQTSIKANATMPICIMGSVAWSSLTDVDSVSRRKSINTRVVGCLLLQWWNAFRFNQTTVGHHYKEHLSALSRTLYLDIWTSILETAVYIISMNKNVFEWPETECKRLQIQGEVNVQSCCVSNFLHWKIHLFPFCKYLDTSAIFYKYIEITDGCETWIHIMSWFCSDIYNVQTLTSICFSCSVSSTVKQKNYLLQQPRDTRN